jgi:hypothetical protein
MSLLLFGAQLSNTFWRSKLQEEGQMFCVSSLAQYPSLRFFDLPSFFCSAVSKAFKRLCFCSISPPLRYPTFAGSKPACEKAMVPYSASGLYLLYSKNPYICDQRRHTIAPCSCLNKYFKNCISASAAFLESVQNLELAFMYSGRSNTCTNLNKMGSGPCLRFYRGSKISALL